MSGSCLQGIRGYSQGVVKAAFLSGCSKSLLASSVTMFTQICALDLCGWKCYPFIKCGLEASLKSYRHWKFPDIGDLSNQTTKVIHSSKNNFPLVAFTWLNQAYPSYPLNELERFGSFTFITQNLISLSVFGQQRVVSDHLTDLTQFSRGSIHELCVLGVTCSRE